LGIYRRTELFPVAFLKDLTKVCLETKVGELYSTPWKSLIIKGVAPADRDIWDHLLGKYRINVRHAANELNWQVEDNNEDGLILKRHVIRYFDKEDVRTYGLCFAVKTLSSSGIFGSVIIRKQERDIPNRLKSLERYEILYTADFNPNSSDYILFRNNVEKENLGVYLVSLCKMYYESRSNAVLTEVIKPASTPVKVEPEPQLIYQCKHCMTTYNEETGDPDNNIAAGTAFDNLPASYSCPLCEAPKEDFKVVYEGKLILNSL
jgi:rubredoxin